MTGGRPPLFVDVATPDDLDAVVLLEARSHPTPWSRAQFKGALAGEAGQRVLVLHDVHRRLAGYVVLQVVLDELHVHNVVVEPDLRRLGLGRTLLEVVLRWGAHRGCREAWLEVRRSNAAAIALYEGSGFGQAGVRKAYYTRPKEDALVLRRALQNDR